jgi:ParB family chromosome partitioning protein
MSSRKALGRGLSILYGEESQEVGGGDVPRGTIPLSFITPNPFQPRIDFHDEPIEDLARSIKEQGLLQPIVVRKISDQDYQIVSGERRFRALKLLEESEAPVIIREDIDDKQMLELALVENIQREDLNEIEVALSYKKLIEDCNYSHQQLSERLGKSRTQVTNILRLLKLPEGVQQFLRSRQITFGHAKALLGIDNPTLQLQLAQEIIRDMLTVRDIDKKISQILNRGAAKEDSDDSEGSKALAKKEGVLANEYLSALAKIKRSRGFDLNIVETDKEKGKIEVKFTNIKEFKKIIAFFSKEDEDEQ